MFFPCFVARRSPPREFQSALQYSLSVVTTELRTSGTMKTICLMLLASLCFLPQLAIAEQETNRPNIVWIISDDLGPELLRASFCHEK